MVWDFDEPHSKELPLGKAVTILGSANQWWKMWQEENGGFPTNPSIGITFHKNSDILSQVLSLGWLGTGGCLQIGHHHCDSEGIVQAILENLPHTFEGCHCVTALETFWIPVDLCCFGLSHHSPLMNAKTTFENYFAEMKQLTWLFSLWISLVEITYEFT